MLSAVMPPLQAADLTTLSKRFDLETHDRDATTGRKTKRKMNVLHAALQQLFNEFRTELDGPTGATAPKVP